MGQSLREPILNLRRKGLTFPAIAAELGCTISVISYHCKGLGLTNAARSPTPREVAEMQRLYDGGLSIAKIATTVNRYRATVARWITTNPKVDITYEQKQKQRSQRVQRRRKQLKVLLVEYKGGCCELCGYNKCIRALEFHHKDPTTKSFGLGFSTYSLTKMKAEADLCSLLCANCHREVEEETHKKAKESLA